MRKAARVVTRRPSGAFVAAASIDRPEDSHHHEAKQRAAHWVARKFGLRLGIARLVAAEAGLGSRP
jgi:hypothetical protein